MGPEPHASDQTPGVTDADDARTRQLRVARALPPHQRFMLTLLAIAMLAAVVGVLRLFNEQPYLVAAVAGVGALATQRLARANRGAIWFWPAAMAFWPFFILFVAYAGWLLLDATFSMLRGLSG